MRRPPFSIAVVLCALALGGRAPAAGYDDFQDGCWQLPQTWTSTTGSYPQSPGDQAVIDSNEVQAVWDHLAGSWRRGDLAVLPRQAGWFLVVRDGQARARRGLGRLLRRRRRRR